MCDCDLRSLLPSFQNTEITGGDCKVYARVKGRIFLMCDLLKPFELPKVGDRVRITQTRNRNLSHWKGHEATVASVNDQTISVLAGEGKQKKHLTLKHGWYASPIERIKQFKVGDRIISKHPLCLEQILEIAKYPNVYANGSVSYESLVTTTNLVLGIDQVSLAGNDQDIKKVGEPWDSPQEWLSIGVRCSYENDLIIWGDKHFKIQPKIKEKYLNPRVLVDFLRDGWHVLQCFCKPKVKSSQPATEKEIIAHFGCKASYAKSVIRLGVNSGILTKLKGGKYEISSQPLIEEINTRVTEEAEKLFNNQQSCLQPDISIVEVAAIQKERSPQDTDLSGQLTTTQVPLVFTESDSQESCSLSKISDPLQMSLLPDCQYQMSAYSLHLVQIFPWLVSELDLLEFADNCFLKDSDLFDSNAQVHLCLRTLTDSLAQTTQLPSRKSSKRLQVWGIAAPGNLGMVTGTSPKTEKEFLSWAVTADVRATQPKPTKKTLQEVFETQTIPVKVYVDDVAEAIESPALCAGGWQHRSPLHQDKRGASFAVLYRAAGGDRLYTEVAPTLRSLSNTGNHQAGNGAYKIRAYLGENYLERPINATEAEQLMGWEVGSTATGINKEGDEITVSQTQRIKILGNGIIPAEITDILTAIKPILERKLESEVPENMRFAYQQLRQKGMSHQEILKLICNQ